MVLVSLAGLGVFVVGGTTGGTIGWTGGTGAVEVGSAVVAGGAGVGPVRCWTACWRR